MTTMSTAPSANDPTMPGATGRQPASPVLPVILDRWSPRAFRDHAMTEPELLALLEAARWAPSSHNSQPWRFAYALRGDAHWDTFQGFCNTNNARWAHAASALVLIASRTRFPNARTGELEPARMHTFDAGCAWGYLALQAAHDGWACHAMAGIERDKARAGTGLPDDHELHCMVAIGKAGDPAGLPDDLRAREKISGRADLRTLARPGSFSGG
jgi:nitroreductase